MSDFRKDYEEMNINGTIFNCPYWMNKIKNGKVVLRGFKDGKGEADEIRTSLNDKLDTLEINDTHPITPLFLRKLAKKERIGIDCSGFVYRVLDELTRLKYHNCNIKSLDGVFSGGINKTNADTLTHRKYSDPVNNIADYRHGDLIRMMGGKHVLVIISVTDSRIIYAHSSHITETQGVHRGQIRITDVNESLDRQDWLEETKDGQNFGFKHFHTDKGDGVYRLKIFY